MNDIQLFVVIFFTMVTASGASLILGTLLTHYTKECAEEQVQQWIKINLVVPENLCYDGRASSQHCLRIDTGKAVDYGGQYEFAITAIFSRGWEKKVQFPLGSLEARPYLLRWEGMDISGDWIQRMLGKLEVAQLKAAGDIARLKNMAKGDECDD